MKNLLKSGLLILILFSMPCIYSRENKNIVQDQNENQDCSLASAGSTVKQDFATIHFTRKASMMGAIVPHVVIDRGDSANFNIHVIQRKTFEPGRSNFDVAVNVPQMYLITAGGKNLMIAGFPQKKIDIRILKGSPEYNLVKADTTISPELFSYIESQSFYSHPQELVPNASLAGIVRSGETIVWQRAPGTVQLEVITTGGDQAFAPAFKVEAGKTYEVTYTYMKASFEIIEKR
jgi:hypothetical protein